VHQDLIAQARALAKLDAKGKPKQANLKRAVSAAYYALFHFLVEEASRALIGSQHGQQGYRQSLARAFTHSTMKSACSSFGAGQLPTSVIKPLPRNPKGNYAVPKAIQHIADAFKELQQKRFLADYDLSERFKRSEVLTHIEEVEERIHEFARLRHSNDRQFFLVCLLAWKELASR
jgi:hypothetical protein